MGDVVQRIHLPIHGVDWIPLLLVGIALCSESKAAEWQAIQPARTPEKELISSFGAPQEIVVTFPWNEWSARWKVRPTSTSHVLRYRSDGPMSPLLQGPGGLASDAEVSVFNGIVHSVTWYYGGPSARAAARILRNDPSVNFTSQESPSTGGKALLYGILFIEIGRDDTSVKVHLELK
jgi:hypothetical protein